MTRDEQSLTHNVEKSKELAEEVSVGPPVVVLQIVVKVI